MPVSRARLNRLISVRLRASFIMSKTPIFLLNNSICSHVCAALFQPGVEGQYRRFQATCTYGRNSQSVILGQSRIAILLDGDLIRWVAVGDGQRGMVKWRPFITNSLIGERLEEGHQIGLILRREI